MDIERRPLLEQRVAGLEPRMAEADAERAAWDAMADQAEADAAAVRAEWVPYQPEPISRWAWIIAGLVLAIVVAACATWAGAAGKRARLADCAATLPGVRVTGAQTVSAAEAFARPGLHPGWEHLRPSEAPTYTVLTTATGAALCGVGADGHCACAPASERDDRQAD